MSDKILYKMWLTNDEENLLNNIEIIPSVAWNIFLKVKKRGDLIKA